MDSEWSWNKHWRKNELATHSILHFLHTLSDIYAEILWSCLQGLEDADGRKIYFLLLGRAAFDLPL